MKACGARYRVRVVVLERVCFTLKVDQPELWVLTLIVRDGGGVEIERQSGAIWVSR